ncbi:MULTISPECIES: zinc ABC transporter permease subunit ZnuB [Marinomonas]|uniref:zinc ABC transporter permease subunit ZnuB n=1 Tax=Marinomonas TaxID=28253 RepID=UPI00105573A9|nr:zinc ABC transporter permease subunit ZnuB [Marinomonas flavescens]
MLEFLIRALLGGLGVAAVAGPLGAFVVWRRMAYFGDTLAHSALLGVALGFLFNINLNLAIVVLCVGLAAILVTLQKKQIIATDTLLGILAHSSLSLGLVAVSFLDNVRIDLMAYLFGDLLAVSQTDLYWIYGGGILVLTLLVTFWKPLLAVTVNEELAKVEGYPVEAIRLLLMLLVALVIAVAMKIVGVLLITSLMIIPAATARKLSNTPIQMATISSFIGCLAVCGGLWASYRWDTPTGPSVVVCAALLFIIAYSSPFKRRSA